MVVYTFRFDDVSVNTDAPKLNKMIRFLRSTFRPQQLRLIFAISPAVVDMSRCESLHRERTFPSIWHTQSDFRIFYRMHRVGVPPFIEDYRNEGVEIAGHGMIHVDHRLLTRSVQELSILLSCSLLNTNKFLPPFHKWNEKTEDICREHSVSLIKYDASWRHLLYHPFDPRTENYYVHPHDFDYQSFCARFS